MALALERRTIIPQGNPRSNITSRHARHLWASVLFRCDRRRKCPRMVRDQNAEMISRKTMDKPYYAKLMTLFQDNNEVYLSGCGRCDRTRAVQCCLSCIRFEADVPLCTHGKWARHCDWGYRIPLLAPMYALVCFTYSMVYSTRICYLLVHPFSFWTCVTGHT